jgi:hypothetical protein
VLLIVTPRPIAVNDNYRVNKNTQLVVLPPGVLGNDTDTFGNPLTAIKLTNPTSGTLTAFNSDGSFTYTPIANYVGSASFTYKVNNGLSDSLVATVTIKVNGPPVAVANSYRFNMNTVLTVPAPGVLGNDTDPNGDTLTAVLVTPPNPLRGSLVLNADGSFAYTPVIGFVGLDSFTYKAYDGLLYSTLAATVTIKVNGPAVAVADIYRVNNGTSLTVPARGVLINDRDPNVDLLTAILVTPPVRHTGIFILNPDGSFTYTPVVGFVGTDSFTYKANDGLLDSNIATVTIKANGAPVAFNDSYRVNTNTTLTVLARGVLTNDTDPNLDTLTAVKVTDPANGVLTLNANGSFTYVPVVGYVGTDSFTYKAYDGLLYSNVATVNLKVNGAPIAVNDGVYNANKNTALIIPLPGVLSNDTDPNIGDTLTAVKVTSPANGTVTLYTTGAFTYIPALNYTGSDSFTYKVYDGLLYSNIATVSLKVNGPPVAVADSYNVTKNTTLIIPSPGVLGNDTDPEGDPLTAVRVVLPHHGTLTTFNSNGSFTYTPIANYVGLDTFTYKAYDGRLYSNIVTVTLNVTALAALLANFPNPFNPETWIPYDLSVATKVEVMIYASSGQLVRKLDLGHKSAGSYREQDKSAYWDGKNEAGEFVGSGIYFYTIKAGDFVATRKMVMMK